MPKIVKPSLLTLPQTPTDDSHLLAWARELTEALTDHFGKSALSTPGNPVKGSLLNGRHSAVQQLSNGFTIAPVESFVRITSSTDVISAADIAIARGHDAQFMIINNIGAFNVTIKNNALTKFTGGDIVIPASGAALFAWNDADTPHFWIKI